MTDRCVSDTRYIEELWKYCDIPQYSPDGLLYDHTEPPGELREWLEQRFSIMGSEYLTNYISKVWIPRTDGRLVLGFICKIDKEDYTVIFPNTGVTGGTCMQSFLTKTLSHSVIVFYNQNHPRFASTSNVYSVVVQIDEMQCVLSTRPNTYDGIYNPDWGKIESFNVIRMGTNLEFDIRKMIQLVVAKQITMQTLVEIIGDKILLHYEDRLLWNHFVALSQ